MRKSNVNSILDDKERYRNMIQLKTNIRNERKQEVIVTWSLISCFLSIFLSFGICLIMSLTFFFSIKVRWAAANSVFLRHFHHSEFSLSISFSSIFLLSTKVGRIEYSTDGCWRSNGAKDCYLIVDDRVANDHLSAEFCERLCVIVPFCWLIGTALRYESSSPKVTLSKCRSPKFGKLRFDNL
jgi:hypothetical protein